MSAPPQHWIDEFGAQTTKTDLSVSRVFDCNGRYYGEFQATWIELSLKNLFDLDKSVILFYNYNQLNINFSP